MSWIHGGRWSAWESFGGSVCCLACVAHHFSCSACFVLRCTNLAAPCNFFLFSFYLSTFKTFFSLFSIFSYILFYTYRVKTLIQILPMKPYISVIVHVFVFFCQSPKLKSSLTVKDNLYMAKIYDSCSILCAIGS